MSKTARVGIPTGLEEVWPWLALLELCDGIFDCPHSTPALTASGPLLARSQDIRAGYFNVRQAASVSESTYLERTRRAEPHVGDLLFSREGTYFGIAAEVPAGTRVCLGQRMVLIRPSPRLLDSRFLKYWLNSSILERHLLGYHDGTVAQRLNVSTIRGLPIPAPPLCEQRAIASTLGALDDKIELNREMNRTLEATAQAIFKSWFVDFDPVMAKADGRKPFGMSDEIAGLFPDRFQESELGPIPEGWQCRSVASTFDVNPRRRLRRQEVAPYLSMQDLPNHQALPLQWQLREYGNGVRFQNGDTLVAKITPCLENGKTAFVWFMEDEQVGWGSTELIVLASRTPFPPEAAYLLARLSDFRNHLVANMSGSSGRQRVDVACLDAYWLAIAPEPILRSFAALSRTLFAKMAANVAQSQTLAELRDLLLPKLLSGEIRIAQAERVVEDAGV